MRAEVNKWTHTKNNEGVVLHLRKLEREEAIVPPFTVGSVASFNPMHSLPVSFYVAGKQVKEGALCFLFASRAHSPPPRGKRGSVNLHFLSHQLLLALINGVAPLGRIGSV